MFIIKRKYRKSYLFGHKTFTSSVKIARKFETQKDAQHHINEWFTDSKFLLIEKYSVTVEVHEQNAELQEIKGSSPRRWFWTGKAGVYQIYFCSDIDPLLAELALLRSRNCRFCDGSWNKRNKTQYYSVTKKVDGLLFHGPSDGRHELGKGCEKQYGKMHSKTVNKVFDAITK